MRPVLRGRHLGRIIGVAALASLALQQSPANEAIRVGVGLWVLDRTGSPLAVGLSLFACTAAIDGTTSVLIALGLHTETGVVRRIMTWARDRYGSRAGGDERTTRGLGLDAVLSLGVGAGLVVARRHFGEESPELGRDLTTALLATLFVAVATGFVGFLAGGGLEYAERIGLGTPAQWIVDYGSDWRIWAILLVLAVAVPAVRRRLGRHGEVRSEGPNA